LATSNHSAPMLSRARPARGRGPSDVKPRPFLGIQTFAHDYLLEGAETAARNMQARGFTQMLFAATYVKENKWTNHEPGHEYAVEAGLYFDPDLKLYRDSGVTPRRAPAQGMEGYNALAEVSQAARKVGIGLWAWMSDYDQRLLAPDYPELRLVGANGQPAEGDWFCPNNPQARAYVAALYEDVARNYDIDGFFMDRIRYPSATNACYCQHCREAMERQGLDAERVMGAARAMSAAPGQRMSTAMGLSFRNIFEEDNLVELAQWMRFRQHTIVDHVRQVRGLVRKLRPEWGVGLDVLEPTAAPSLGQNFSLLAREAEWFKPMLYHHSAALGVRGWVETMAAAEQVPPAQAYEQVRALFTLQGIAMPSWEEFGQHGMPPNWLHARIKYCQQLAGEHAAVYPGIQGWGPATTDEIRAMLNSAFDAGAPGIITFCYSNVTWDKLDAYREVFKQRVG